MQQRKRWYTRKLTSQAMKHEKPTQQMGSEEKRTMRMMRVKKDEVLHIFLMHT